MGRRITLAATALTLAMAGVACGDDEAATEGPRSGGEVEAPDGFRVSEVVDGLDGPTQMVLDADGALVVAHLNGAEDGGDGQVLRIDLDRRDAEPEVLFDGLVSPTGVAVLDDEIWVMEERTLSRGPIEGGELEVVLDDLPFNGRSEGTLTATPDGDLLYNTSGALDGTSAAEGSATLFSLTPGRDPVPLATGFKHAYARVLDADGTLWQTEVSEGSFGGDPIPDELVSVEPGDDFGWPRCVGDRVPVELNEGTEELCADTPRSHVVFEPAATPTSVEVAPWDPDLLVVALWVEGRVVTVPRRQGEGPVEPSTFVSGIEHPQHLLADGDRLLVSDHETGRILAVERA